MRSSRGGFEDNPWLERWDVRFADLYLDAFDRFEATGRTVGPWQVAFERRPIRRCRRYGWCSWA